MAFRGHPGLGVVGLGPEDSSKRGFLSNQTAGGERSTPPDYGDKR